MIKWLTRRTPAPGAGSREHAKDSGDDRFLGQPLRSVGECWLVLPSEWPLTPQSRSMDGFCHRWARRK